MTCPKCKNCEGHPVDEQRHHLQSFEIIKWLDEKDFRDVSYKKLKWIDYYNRLSFGWHVYTRKKDAVKEAKRYNEFMFHHKNLCVRKVYFRSIRDYGMQSMNTPCVVVQKIKILKER